jgi:glycosyltransferase involved in cell wall biosynthesis
VAGSTEFPGHAAYAHDGVPVERISSPLFPHWRASSALASRIMHAARSAGEALRLWRRLAVLRFDVLHVFGSSSVTAAAIAYAALTRKPVIVELVTTRASALQTLPGLRIAGLLRRRLRDRCLIVAISAALGERSAADGFTDNVWVRPNPVDLARFRPEPARRATLRATLTPFAADDVVLVTVAKFMPQKNQIFLLDVLAALPERFKLVLAGPMVADGPLAPRDQAYFQELRQRIARLGLAKRVHVVAEFVAAEDFIKLADVYMLPNRDEGLATPMLESLACAVPVVANAGEAAFRQWVSDGRSGFLRPLDAAAWADAVQRAVALPPEDLSDAARAVAEAAAADKIDRQFLHLLQTLAALPPGRPLDVAATLRDGP